MTLGLSSSVNELGTCFLNIWVKEGSVLKKDSTSFGSLACYCFEPLLLYSTKQFGDLYPLCSVQLRWTCSVSFLDSIQTSSYFCWTCF